MDERASGENKDSPSPKSPEISGTPRAEGQDVGHSIRDGSKPKKPRHRTIKQRWVLISLPNKLMVIATVVIAGAGIVNLLVAVAMWSEMRSSGRQTDQLLGLYGKQIEKLGHQVNETHGLVVKTQASIDAANTNAIADRRPYVWTIQEEIPRVKLGEKVGWNYHYTNFGKSPAVGVAPRCQVRLLAHKTPELKDMFAPIHKRGYEYEGTIVPPGDSSNWSTCFSQEIVTEEDLKMMNTYDAGAKLMIYFEYFDTNWNIYTSQVCWIIRRPGAGSATAPCPAENKIR